MTPKPSSPESGGYISPEYAAELGRQVDELEAENAALRHDLERHITIASDLLTPAQTQPSHIEQTKDGVIDWKMEVERLNRLINQLEERLALTSTEHQQPQTDVMKSAERALKQIESWSDSKRDYAERATAPSSLTRPDGEPTKDSHCWCGIHASCRYQCDRCNERGAFARPKSGGQNG